MNRSSNVGMARRACLAAAVACLALLAGCARPSAHPQPGAAAGTPLTTPTATAGPLSKLSTPTASPVPGAAGQATPPGTTKTSRPPAPPQPSLANDTFGELALMPPPACYWVPKAFLSGQGGISVQLSVRSTGVSVATHVPLTVVGNSGERGSTTLTLPKGDFEQTASVITNADEGSYQARLTMTVDPAHSIYQTKGYTDDSARIVLIVPFPRPSTTTQLSCNMYQ